jgi:glycosyltransferase involved in cell wall biosynthesis
LNGYVHAALDWRAPVLVVAHSCVLSWWRAVKGEDAPVAWSRYREKVTRGLRSAHLVAAPSRAMLAQVDRWYGPLHTGVVIPNGRSRAAAGDLAKEPMVFAAGRLWDDAKNLTALDGAAADLPWPVYVAGDTRHPDGSERRSRSVHTLGVLPATEVARWMDRAAIYALPARYEPFGLSVLEAAQAGCALVLGNIPSLRENWEGAAEFVAPDSTAGLCAALRRLMYDHAHRGRLAAAARDRAAGFTPDRMARAYLAAYHVLMSGRRLHKHAGSSWH